MLEHAFTVTYYGKPYRVNHFCGAFVTEYHSFCHLSLWTTLFSMQGAPLFPARFQQRLHKKPIRSPDMRPWGREFSPGDGYHGNSVTGYILPKRVVFDVKHITPSGTIMAQKKFFLPVLLLVCDITSLQRPLRWFEERFMCMWIPISGESKRKSMNKWEQIPEALFVFC